EGRLFAKAKDSMDRIIVGTLAQTYRIALRDVPETRAGPGWLDADGDKLACLLRDVGSQGEGFLKGCAVCNQVIGRENKHDGCVIASRSQTVPRATAAAVSRLAGSATIFSFGKFPSSLRTALSCSVFVRIKMRSRGIKPSSRPRVSSSRVSAETRRSNCLGRARRLNGQNRSPLPPARISA